LRRRLDPQLHVDVYEVKLDDEFLMSSLFTTAEVALAQLGLAALPSHTDLDVIVGGLGLGYTARAIAADPRVRYLGIVEALDAVIDWHQRDLLPDATVLTKDPRVHFIHADFFASATDPAGFDPDRPQRRFDAILLDIDHSPRHVLNPRHADCYQPAGLRHLATQLRPGGVFALWSNDPPDDQFEQHLAEAFAQTHTHVVNFHNPLQNRQSANTVYVATTPRHRPHRRLD
ncbi:MAG: spermidine synthase, partial [Stackebrandtia sp.]